MKRILSVGALLVAGITIGATNRYVSPSGTGDGSSPSSPTTWTTAFSSLQSGDSLFLLSGQYDFSSKQTIGTSKSGTADKRTFIGAYKDATPILDFREEVYGERGITISTNVQYVHIKGLTIRYTGKNAILNQGNYCVIESIDTYGNGDTGIQHKAGGGNLILNCDSHDNFDYKSGTLTNTNFGGNADGFVDKQYSNTVGSNTYRNCRAWGNSDDGWDFYQRSGATTYLENCICYNNGPATIDLSTNPRLTGVDASWAAGMIGETVETTRDKVSGTYTISLAAFPNGGNGNGFKIGGDYTVNNVVLTNCLSAGNFARGFDQNNNAGSMTLYNCSGYNNGVNFGFSNISGSSVLVRNCVSYTHARGSDYFQCPTTDVAYCSWNVSGVSVNASDFESLDVAQLTATRADDDTYNRITFMQPVSTSDLLDKGAQVGLPFSGTAPDLGWIEVGVVDQFPPALSVNGVTSQFLKAGNAISSVSFVWAGGATGVSLSELPSGLSSQTSAETKTVTISGTPTSAGNYTITATTEGGTGVAMSASFTLVVKSVDAKVLAYVTTTGSDAADAPILEAINAMPEYLTEIVDVTASASATKDYTSYGMVVISPVPGSTAAGVANLETYAGRVPMLLLKPWNLKPSAWNWGTAVNTTASTITLTAQGAAHPIFDGLSNPTTVFSAIGKNAITGITHSTWESSAVNASDITVLANPSGDEATDAVVEIAKDVSINGVANTQPFLMIGVSEASTANLTNDAKLLIQNACKYVLANAEPISGVGETDASTTVVKSNYFNLQGQKFSAPVSGIVLRQDILSNGTTHTTKVMR